MTVDAVAEILTQPERRRWNSEQKLALVAESLRPGASPTQAACRYGISTGLLYTWRHLARSGELAMVPMAPSAAQFVPVEIVSEVPAAAEAAGVGIMVIELPGERRIRVRHVDADALRRVLQALGASE